MSKFEEELAQRGKELENVAVEREWTEKTVKGPDQEKEVILDSLAEEKGRTTNYSDGWRSVLPSF